MKKKAKIIQINGFRGIFLMIFIACCLAAGFLGFPALVAMHTWNYLSVTTGSFAQINFLQGLLLWGIVLMSIFIFNKRKFIVSVNVPQELSEEEVKSVLDRFKSQKLDIKEFAQKMNEDVKEEILQELEKKESGNKL